MLGKAKGAAKGILLRATGGRAADRILDDDRGVSDGIDLAVTLSIGALMVGVLVPMGVDEIVAVDTTSWPAAATTVWDLLPVMVGIAVLLFFIGYALNKADL